MQKQRYEFGGEKYRAMRRMLCPVPGVEAGVTPTLKDIDAAGADLALVQLDRPVRNVQPATRYRGTGEVGRTMTKVGYGVVGDGLVGMYQLWTQERRVART